MHCWCRWVKRTVEYKPTKHPTLLLIMLHRYIPIRPIDLIPILKIRICHFDTETMSSSYEYINFSRARNWPDYWVELLRESGWHAVHETDGLLGYNHFLCYHVNKRFWLIWPVVSVDEKSGSTRYQVHCRKQAGNFWHERMNEPIRRSSVHDVQLGWQCVFLITGFTHGE